MLLQKTCRDLLSSTESEGIFLHLNDIASFLALNGGPGLFLFCLIAATLLPISSEAALLGAMSLGMDAWEALAWASAGNCIGVGLNYLVGYLFSEKVQTRLSKGKWGTKALDWVHRYGVWCLFLSWTPFLGDPLTYAAGIFRIPFHYLLLIAFPLRVARYLVFVLFYV
ncbi:MAG: YqaA family protein [Candidatus Kapaibacterium sp.]